jgi:two-component system sensor histidine kinase KdpD
MLKKGRTFLEVVASTNPEIVGVRQPIEEESPSAWVARTGEPLYVDGSTGPARFQRRSGRYRKNAFLLVPVINQGKVIGVISVTEKIDRDRFSRGEREILLKVAGQVISALEAQRLADDLRRKRRTLQQRNRRLRELERLKTDLFRMLIHDLKGPISELMANLDILSYTASEDNRGYVKTAKSSCDTLYSMVSNLLDIARLEEGKLELVYERIEPEDLLREAMARLYWSMELKRLRFEETFGPDPEPFWADRGLLLRVLQNLLTNAVAYSPEGEAVAVGFDRPVPGVVRFSVEDRGPGVPPDHQEAIFDKYAQLEKKGDGRMYTTGLGLTFCKMAVEAHRGRIGVESDGRAGSRFLFELPVEKGKRLPAAP